MYVVTVRIGGYYRNTVLVRQRDDALRMALDIVKEESEAKVSVADPKGKVIAEVDIVPD